MKNQSFQDFEVIFIDDGSNDGTRDYLKYFCDKNKQFKLILKQPEGSPAKSRIVGVDKAKGEYLAFCDHDDFWHPRKLELQMKAYEKHPSASIVHTRKASLVHSFSAKGNFLIFDVQSDSIRFKKENVLCRYEYIIFFFYN